MTEMPRIYLDTNAFIFAVEEQSERSSLLIKLFSSSEEAENVLFVTSELTLAEVLVKPYRNVQEELIDRYDNMIRDSAWLEVQPVVRPTLWYASVLRSQSQLKLPDAIHLSTAFGSECTHFLTDDRALRVVDELRHTRFGMTKMKSIEMVPLTIPALTSLLKSLAA
ncbi:type II toxin-antitoxin system VapC family toxin [Pararhizobium sp.]|uniref:type II toxin-antitoxin system VapC family toxin n=1 Tax=Pararhizobium sp. TaxID=1977563 RepID=UPI00271987E5|nr:type II toxin-antitoxin system VapC family toxin [Pararhizobium sp.]MDO9417868.1 type II toxin-antitoxin system VapC family toxin [Pararhizobium sp.]